MTAQEESDVLNAMSRDLDTDGNVSRADAVLAAQATIDHMNLASTRTTIAAAIDAATTATLSNAVKKKIAKRAIELWTKTE